MPIGAVLVHRDSGKIVAKAGNRSIEMSDPTSHAEILVIRKICQELGVQRLPEYDIYVTIEPCPMCAAALSFARIGHIIFGASDPKSGGITSNVNLYAHAQLHHKPNVKSGLMADECREIMQSFFAEKRK